MTTVNDLPVFSDGPFVALLLHLVPYHYIKSLTMLQLYNIIILL